MSNRFWAFCQETATAIARLCSGPDPSLLNFYLERVMIANILVGMLCIYLLTFTVMFMLISRRLPGNKMGMDVFAAGNLMLGGSYVLQLLQAGVGWSWLSLVNQTLTVCSLLAYGVGGARFFGHSAPLLRPLLGLLLGYSLLQGVVHWLWGPVARPALLAAVCALFFLGAVLTLLQGVRSFARDMRGEMLFFAALISGICVLNAIKFGKLLWSGLPALDMDGPFQMVFYVYMCTLTTILPPSIIWLVLRRLSDNLRLMAARDPLTQLLNRRGLDTAINVWSRDPGTRAYLLLIDIDHFKRINDSYGHHAGDAVLCVVADALRSTVRKGDLVCRLGGEEFVAICVDADQVAAERMAERIRAAIEHRKLLEGPRYARLRCTVTIGISREFGDEASLEQAMRQADAALYRGKNAGRNRVEQAPACPEAGAINIGSDAGVEASTQ